MATIFIQGNGLNGRTWIGSSLLTTGERSEGLDDLTSSALRGTRALLMTLS